MADLPLFALTGLTGFAMWFMLTSAYSRAQAQNIAAAEYTALIWSALLGYVFFAEIPRWQVWAGAAVVVAAVMMSAWDTRQRGCAASRIRLWLSRRLPPTPKQSTLDVSRSREGPLHETDDHARRLRHCRRCGSRRSAGAGRHRRQHRHDGRDGRGADEGDAGRRAARRVQLLPVRGRRHLSTTSPTRAISISTRSARSWTVIRSAMRSSSRAAPISARSRWT